MAKISRAISRAYNNFAEKHETAFCLLWLAYLVTAIFFGWISIFLAVQAIR